MSCRRRTNLFIVIRLLLSTLSMQLLAYGALDLARPLWVVNVAAVTDSNEEGPVGFYCHYHQLRLAWLHALVVNMSRWVRIEIETYIAAALQLRCSSRSQGETPRGKCILPPSLPNSRTSSVHTTTKISSVYSSMLQQAETQLCLDR